MIIEFQFNSKSRGRNIPEAIRIAERCKGIIEDRYYKVKFSDPQDKDLDKLNQLVKRLKGTAIVLGDGETVVPHKFLKAVNCSERSLCKGICRHVGLGYHHIQNFLDDYSGYIDNDILTTSDQDLIRFLSKFLEKVDEKRFKFNNRLFLEHFIRQTEMENRFCEKYEINKARTEIMNLPNEIRLDLTISRRKKISIELTFSIEDFIEDEDNNKK
ncbi:MAG: hypothetical protein ACFFDC_01065 [Promethearchaeota archaeon]